MQKMGQAASAAVYALDATGERAVDGIEDQTATISIGKLEDPSALQAVCAGGGEGLLTFTRLLTLSIGLPGVASNPSCQPAQDGFTISLHLHNEFAKNNLFSIAPSHLNLELEAEEPDTGSQESTFPAHADAEKMAALMEAEEHRPLHLNPFKTHTSHSTLRLAASWTVDQLPPSVHSDSPFASFDREYTFADGVLVADEKLVIRKDKVEGVERPAYDKWLQDSGINAYVTVRLASTSYRPWSAYEGATEAEKKAVDLMSKSGEATRKKEYERAAKLLDESEAADPGHQLLHHNRGQLAEAQGHTEEALKEYKEELRSFPESSIEMEDIARVQHTMGRIEDTVTTLQSWMAAAPDNPFPAIELILLLHDEHRDDQAAAEADRAMLVLHEDAKRSTLLQEQYARIQMLTGHPERAEGVLLKLLDHSTDALTLNNAAYYLSEHGLALDRAEKIMRDTLASYDVDEDDEADVTHGYSNTTSALLLSSWDTLGWILFQQKNTGEAEGYIRAAWQSHQDPAIGLHLGTLLLSQEKPVEALDVFHLALASVPQGNRSRMEGDPDVVLLHKQIEALEKAGNVSTMKDYDAALIKMRTLDAGPAGNARGEYAFNVTMMRSGISGYSPENLKGRELPELDKIPTPAYFFPPGSKASLQREATVRCTAAGCVLIFKP